MENQGNTGQQTANWAAPEHDRAQVLIDSIVPVERLFERGRTLARTSRIVDERPEDTQSLTEYALAIARDTHIDDYDPGKNHQDRLRETEHSKDVNDCQEAELILKYAIADASEREAELAQLTTGMKEPHVSPWTFVFAVTVLSLSVSPTLHDRFFFTVRDQVLAWFFSGCGGIVVGAFIAWALIGSADTAGRRTAPNIIGLLSGIGIGLAIGAVRIADAHTLDQYIFGLGLTLLEISCVCTLEWLASGLRSRYAEWDTYRDAFSKAAARLQAARENEARCKQDFEARQQKKDAHLRYVESRWVRHNKVSDIEGASVKAILNGYRQGIAENLGRIRGLRQAS